MRTGVYAKPPATIWVAKEDTQHGSGPGLQQILIVFRSAGLAWLPASGACIVTDFRSCGNRGPETCSPVHKCRFDPMCGKKLLGIQASILPGKLPNRLRRKGPQRRILVNPTCLVMDPKTGIRVPKRASAQNGQILLFPVSMLICRRVVMFCLRATP